MAAQHIGESGASVHQSLLEISPIGIAILAGDGQILYSNPAFGDVLGTRPPDLRHRPIAEFAPVAARNYVRERVATAAEQGGARCKWATEPNRPWIELFIERALEDSAEFLIVRAWLGNAHAGASLNGSGSALNGSAVKVATPPLANDAAATDVVVPAPEFAVIGTVEEPADDLRTIDITALAADVVDDLRRRTGTTPAVRIQPGMEVRGDAKLLRQVLQHLIDNAIKFVTPGEIARVEIGQSDGVLFVRDHGVGFEPSQAANIFKPFERLPAAQPYPGAGIGLASVKRIVERLGGMVWAISKPGRGATFFVRF